jgi:predicted O-methyltransferase YrrM
MNFTADWFSHNIPNFEKCMNALGTHKFQFLEIGAYEGRSTCWLLGQLENEGTIISIDPFPNMPEVEQRFHDNTREAVKGTRLMLVLMKTSSYEGLSQLIQQKQEFDFIYIDGDHDPATTLADASMAWGLLRQGGVMLFDDYEYPQEPTKCGIDGFLMGFVGKYDLLLKNYQLAVVKK